MSDVNAIHVGMRGRMAMLRAIFLKGDKDAPAGNLSFAQKFRTIAADHNARFKRKKRK